MHVLQGELHKLAADLLAPGVGRSGSAIRHVRLIINSRIELGHFEGLEGGFTCLLEPLDASVAERLLVELSGAGTVWEAGQAAQLVSICCCNVLVVTLIAGFIKVGRSHPQVMHTPGNARARGW